MAESYRRRKNPSSDLHCGRGAEHATVSLNVSVENGDAKYAASQNSHVADPV